LRKWSTISSQNKPTFVVNMMEPQNPIAQMTVITFLRESPNLSRIAEVNASIIEIDDDIPAMISSRKNKKPNARP